MLLCHLIKFVQNATLIFMLVGLTDTWRGVMDEVQEEGDLLTMVFAVTVGKEDLNP